MSLIQLPSGTIVDEVDLKIADYPEPKGRPVVAFKRIEGEPELHQVATSYGTRMMWIRKVQIFRTYDHWRTLKLEGTFVDPTMDITEAPTEDVATYRYEEHRGGTWGQSWWELCPPPLLT